MTCPPMAVVSGAAHSQQPGSCCSSPGTLHLRDTTNNNTGTRWEPHTHLPPTEPPPPTSNVLFIYIKGRGYCFPEIAESRGSPFKEQPSVLLPLHTAITHSSCTSIILYYRYTKIWQHIYSNDMSTKQYDIYIHTHTCTQSTYNNIMMQLLSLTH